MDPNPTPFPGKNKPAKPKPNRLPKEPPISRQSRVFGTVRNANVLPTAKTFPRKQPEWNPTTRVPIPEPARKPKPRSKPTIQEEEEEEEIREKTPIATVSEPGGSEYRSAKICSKCRFDRLETASYWLGQINLSESLGKHFVSAAFFRLALQSNAEPIKKVRLELKRYLARNGNIGGQREWKEVCVSYGMAFEDESDGLVSEKLETPETTNEVVARLDQ